METNKPSSFIKRIDQYLLKNSPVTWSTRIHTACLYGLGFSMLLLIISFIVSNDPRKGTDIYYWVTLVIIISLLAFIFWMIYLLRFNVFKRYGSWKSTDTLKTFIFYFFITLIIVSWPFIPPIVESARANAAYSSEELAKDINDMNIKVCQLERDSIDRRFKADTFEIKNSVIGSQLKYSQDRTDNNIMADSTDSIMTDEVAVPAHVYESDNYYFIDSASLRGKLAQADSLKKISDSVYVIYECPDYNFVYQYSIDYEDKINVLSSMDLYRRALKYKQVINKENTKNELVSILKKYNVSNNDRKQERWIGRGFDYSHQTYMGKIRDKYDLDEVNHVLGNIAEKKYRWDESTINTCWRVAYYITLCLSMFVLIYRHSTKKIFFLSLLTGVVLTIFTGIVIAMTRSDNAFNIWCISYFILFALIASLIVNSRNRNGITGISLNLSLFMTPFMPLIITATYYESLRSQYRNSENLIEYSKYFENEQLHYFLSEIGGVLLLVLLLATIYQKAYRKWFALPEL